MVLKASIKKLRLIAFFLFLMPSLALIGSLFINNYLVNYNFFFDTDYSKYVEDKPNNILKIECNKNNEYCYNHAAYFDISNLKSQIKKLDLCYKNKVEFHVVSENTKYNLSKVFIESSNIEERIQNNFRNRNFFLEIKTIDEKNESCIKNFKVSNTLYPIFPYYYNYVSGIKKVAKLATGESVNPFIYGEVSISNLVKRYPINYVFKPLLYISVVLMLFYWFYYNKIFNELVRKKINLFTVFGILSAIFLFFHVLFLGSENDNELFQKLRKIIIVLFILFELLAQIFLAKDIYKNKGFLLNFCKIFIVYSKIVFVSIVSMITILIILLLSVYNLESKIDYILEWNYFLFLLVFYFLSFLMWKKEI